MNNEEVAHFLSNTDPGVLAELAAEDLDACREVMAIARVDCSPAVEGMPAADVERLIAHAHRLSRIVTASLAEFLEGEF